jgi:hypothetical protein
MATEKTVSKINPSLLSELIKSLIEAVQKMNPSADEMTKIMYK